jgi:branched-subunit amino acid aminotransferase/4-amino-4-deoxychorismate lyase
MKCNFYRSATAPFFTLSALLATWNRNTVTTFGAVLSPTTHRSHQIVLHGWSRQGEFESESVTSAKTRPTVDDGNGLDLVSARLWLESHEAKNSNGAYTVLRCDLSMDACQVWGRDFHLERLCRSYSSLMGTPPVDRDVLDRAMGRSDQLIQALLAEARELLRNAPLRGDEIYILMLTLLWEEPNDTKNQIIVKGHVFCSRSPSIPLQYDPAPISASIALPSNTGPHLPNRHGNLPNAKLSAWCRMRRPLEGVFKVNGMDEVLLTRQYGNDVQLLEGLTSNLFVICKGGILRTPDDGVLGGYARYLVLKAARHLGFHVEVGPLCISELGSWDQMFCTSAIRLVIPVGQLWIAEGNSNEGGPTQLTKVWAANSEEQPARTWRAIYHEILNMHPY